MLLIRARMFNLLMVAHSQLSLPCVRMGHSSVVEHLSRMSLALYSMSSTEDKIVSTCLCLHMSWDF